MHERASNRAQFIARSHFIGHCNFTCVVVSVLYVRRILLTVLRFVDI